VGDVCVLLGWVYLVWVDVLVGVGVVDLDVSLHSNCLPYPIHHSSSLDGRFWWKTGRRKEGTYGVGKSSLDRLRGGVLDGVGDSRLSLGVGSVRLVGGHLVECFDLGSESTDDCSGAHQVIVVNRERGVRLSSQVYIC
jgi:hypothetical protein